VDGESAGQLGRPAPDELMRRVASLDLFGESIDPMSGIWRRDNKAKRGMEWQAAGDYRQEETRKRVRAASRGSKRAR
jgi:hypothetical protein